MNLIIETARRVALGSLFVLAVASTTPAMSVAAERSVGKQRIGLEGYCPVCIVKAKKWMKGNPEIQTSYDGVTYQFPNEAVKKTFLADPAKYVPVLGGDCIVCYKMAGKRVPGSIRHAATHAGRLYLFPSDREKQAFLAAPENFAKTDLALNGNCAVCLKHANKEVSGKPEFTEIHKGFRYQFPSDRERQMFVKNPKRYEATEKSAEPLGADHPPADNPVSVSAELRIRDDHSARLIVNANIADGFHIYAQSQPKPFLATND